jgi:hypothetical protein
MLFQQQQKDILRSGFFFLASVLLTAWFIQAGESLYISTGIMYISGTIAATKWGLQIIAALFFLGDKKWLFIRRIGFTCFAGSAILLPYFLFSTIRLLPNSFFISLVLSVLLMIFLYYRAVVTTGLSIKWFWGWIACLATAILLQLTVVFKVL